MKNSIRNQTCLRLDIVKDIRSMAKRMNPKSQERVFMTRASEAIEEGNTTMSIQLLERVCSSMNLLQGERTRLELYIKSLQPGRFKRFKSAAGVLLVKLLMSVPPDCWVSPILFLWSFCHKTLSVYPSPYLRDSKMNHNEYTLERLAADLDFQTPEELLSFARKAPGMYRSWEIEKDKDNPGKGHRTITAPKEKLKGIQRALLDKVLCRIKTPDYMGAGKGSSTRNTMRPHRDKKMVLSYDISHFFPSVSSKSILRALRDRGFPWDVASVITKLTTHRNQLPQGAPCSTKLAKIVLSAPAKNLKRLLANYGVSVDISFWVDDIIISGPASLKNIETNGNVYRIFSRFKLPLNFDKTKIQPATGEQTALGIRVDHHRLRPSSEFEHKLAVTIKSMPFSSDKVQGMIRYKRYICGQ